MYAYDSTAITYAAAVLCVLSPDQLGAVMFAAEWHAMGEGVTIGGTDLMCAVVECHYDDLLAARDGEQARAMVAWRESQVATA